METRYFDKGMQRARSRYENDANGGLGCGSALVRNANIHNIYIYSKTPMVGRKAFRGLRGRVLRIGVCARLQVRWTGPLPFHETEWPRPHVVSCPGLFFGRRKSTVDREPKALCLSRVRPF